MFGFRPHKKEKSSSALKLFFKWIWVKTKVNVSGKFKPRKVKRMDQIQAFFTKEQLVGKVIRLNESKFRIVSLVAKEKVNFKTKFIYQLDFV